MHFMVLDESAIKMDAWFQSRFTGLSTIQIQLVQYNPLYCKVTNVQKCTKPIFINYTR